jgi:succinate dehydrogenase / fumarate reductase cytochrome b subunit
MAQAQTDARPVAPHLQVWRWHITMVGSILHRVTGVILYLGAIGLVIWLAALAAGPDVYDALIGMIPPWLMAVKLYAVTAVIAYHLLNGLRHLAWDAGAGFRPKVADATNWLVIVLALIAPLGLYALTRF